MGDPAFTNNTEAVINCLINNCTTSSSVSGDSTSECNSLYDYMTVLFNSYTLQDNILPSSGDYGGLLYNTSGVYNYTASHEHGTTTRRKRKTSVRNPTESFARSSSGSGRGNSGEEGDISGGMSDHTMRKLLPFYLPDDHGTILLYLLILFIC